MGVGHTITLADISLCCTLVDGMKLVLDEGFRKPYLNLMRWFNLCTQQPEFSSVIGKVALCSNANKASAPKQDKQAEQAGGKKGQQKPKEQAAQDQAEQAGGKKGQQKPKEQAEKKKAKKEGKKKGGDEKAAEKKPAAAPA